MNIFNTSGVDIIWLDSYMDVTMDIGIPALRAGFLGGLHVGRQGFRGVKR